MQNLRRREHKYFASNTFGKLTSFTGNDNCQAKGFILFASGCESSISSIKSRAKSLKVWTKIEPGSQLRLLEEPTEPEVPSILGHKSYAGVDEPTEVQQLTANGLKT
ncbi:hypothetical protein E4U22_005539 [Claviceps purpurea]|nr:hypothetical protein E4U22_005539 [Claviceps purpurea]